MPSMTATSSLLDLINGSISAIDAIGEFSTSNATLAVPKMDKNDDITSHELSKLGHIAMTIGGEAAMMVVAKQVAANTLDYEIQRDIGIGLNSESVIAESLSKVFGVPNTPGSKLFKTSINVNKNHCGAMADEILSRIEGSPNDASARLLVTSIMVEVFSSLDLYLKGDEVMAFVDPLQSDRELMDPFSYAVGRTAIHSSPFKDLKFDSKKMADVVSGNNVSFVRLVDYVRSVSTDMMTSFAKMAEKVERLLSGLELLGDIIHGRIVVPASWLADPIIVEMRKNLTFHLLTMDPNTANWSSRNNNTYLKLANSITALDAIDPKDDNATILAKQAAIDVEYTTSIKLKLKEVAEAISAYVELNPLDAILDMFTIKQHESRTTRDVLSGVTLSLKHERPEFLDVFSGYKVSGGKTSKAAYSASLLTHAGRITVPHVDMELVFNSLAESFENISDTDLNDACEQLIEEDLLGSILTLIPGTSVPLLTNMNKFDGMEDIDNGYISGESKAPFIVYAAAAGLATEVKFVPGSLPIFVRQATPGNPLRECQSQLSKDATLTKTRIETASPTDLFVASTLADMESRFVFTVRNPMVKLGELVDSEFNSNPAYISDFSLPLNPAKASDRKAAIGRAINKLDKKSFKGGMLDTEFPAFAYERREMLDSDSASFVGCPINLRSNFSDFRHLFVSTVVSHISVSQELEMALDAAQGLRDVMPQGSTAANRIMVSIIKNIATAYMKTGVWASDIAGMDKEANKIALQEFMVYSGLYSFRYLSEQTDLVDVKIIDRVIKSVRSLSDRDFEDVCSHAVSVAAARLR